MNPASIFPISSTTRWLLPFGVSVCVLLTGCERAVSQDTHQNTPMQVQAVAVKEAAPNTVLRLPATAQAGKRAMVYARATGIVAERRADLGDHVTQGQILAIVSAPEVNQAVRQAGADYDQAVAAQELAKTNYERAAKLVSNASISRELYEERKTAQTSAEAAKASAAARLANLREQQGFQTIHAPFAGIVAARNIEQGDRVVGDQGAANTPMFELNNLDPLRIQVDVPQSAVLQIKPGLHAQISFPEAGSKPMDAQVIRVAQSISGTTGGMRVELTLPNPDNRIPAGMVGQVRIEVPRGRSAMVVPIAAVIQRSGEPTLIRIAEDSKLDYRKVVVGRNLGNEMEILEGVAVGDRVVLSPNARLTPGIQVKVEEPAKPNKS